MPDVKKNQARVGLEGFVQSWKRFGERMSQQRQTHNLTHDLAYPTPGCIYCEFPTPEDRALTR